MDIFIDFLHAMPEKDKGICEAAEAIYRTIFESSATDVNRKQIAGEKGITQQGIVQNENLCNLSDNPFGDTSQSILDLMKSSYAARFGQHTGNVSPALNSRTSNGMYGGCGPQNANASCDSQSS